MVNQNLIALEHLESCSYAGIVQILRDMLLQRLVIELLSYRSTISQLVVSDNLLKT